MEHAYHHRKKIQQKKRWRWAILIFVLIILLLAGGFSYDIYRSRSREQTGSVKTQQLNFDNKGPKVKIDEPTFTLELPSDWKEIGRVNSTFLRSVTWQATKQKEDNRFMTIYVDKIPLDKSFNRLLPVETVGAGLRYGNVSDNCAAYTKGGSFEASRAITAKDTLAKWEDVTFWCDLPKVFDNVVGTSSKEAVNSVAVTGPSAGAHKYFFLYTDHNIQPDYQIFTDIISSFSSK